MGFRRSKFPDDSICEICLTNVENLFVHLCLILQNWPDYQQVVRRDSFFFNFSFKHFFFQNYLKNVSKLKSSKKLKKAKFRRCCRPMINSKKIHKRWCWKIQKIKTLTYPPICSQRLNEFYRRNRWLSPFQAASRQLVLTPFFICRSKLLYKILPQNIFFKWRASYHFKAFRNMQAFEFFKLLNKLSFKSNLTFRTQKLIKLLLLIKVIGNEGF